MFERATQITTISLPLILSAAVLANCGNANEPRPTTNAPRDCPPVGQTAIRHALDIIDSPTNAIHDDRRLSTADINSFTSVAVPDSSLNTVKYAATHFFKKELSIDLSTEGMSVSTQDSQKNIAFLRKFTLAYSLLPKAFIAKSGVKSVELIDEAAIEDASASYANGTHTQFARTVYLSAPLAGPVGLLSATSHELFHGFDEVVCKNEDRQADTDTEFAKHNPVGFRYATEPKADHKTLYNNYRGDFIELSAVKWVVEDKAYSFEIDNAFAHKSPNTDYKTAVTLARVEAVIPGFIDDYRSLAETERATNK